MASLHDGAVSAGEVTGMRDQAFLAAIRGPSMGKLFQTIQQLVAEEKYVVGQHASERLEERGIMDWQAITALADGERIGEKPKDKPSPTVEVRERLPDARL